MHCVGAVVASLTGFPGRGIGDVSINIISLTRFDFRSTIPHGGQCRQACNIGSKTPAELFGNAVRHVTTMHCVGAVVASLTGFPGRGIGDVSTNITSLTRFWLAFNNTARWSMPSGM